MATSPVSPPRRPPVWAWLIAAALVLAASAWVALAMLFPPATLRALIDDQLHHALRREVRYADVSLRLWPPVRMALTRPELAEPGGFVHGSAFRADAVDLDLDVFALFSHRIKVQQLLIEQPALHVLQRADGTTNLDDIMAPQPPLAAKAAPPALDLDIRRVRITGGRVLLDDARTNRRTAFALTTDLSLATQHAGTRFQTAGTTELSALAWGSMSAARASDLQQGLARLVFRLEHKGVYDAPTQRLALEQLALQLGHASISLTGRVDDVVSHPRYDLRARGSQVELGDVLGWVAAADAPMVKGIAGRGKLAFDLGLRGAAPVAGAPAALPSMRGWLTLAEAGFRYAGARAEVKDLSLRADFAPDSVRVHDVRASVAGQPLTARMLATQLADPVVAFALAGDLDLAAVGPLVPGGTQGAALGGHARVDLQGRGRPAEATTFTLDGSAVLRDVSVARADLPSKVTGINGTVAFAQTSAAAKGLTATAGKSSFTLDARITHPLALMGKPGEVAPAGVTFDFRSPYLDLAELLPTTAGAPFLPNAAGSGTVAIARLRQGKLDVSNVTADVTLAPARLDSPRFSVVGYGGTILGSAKFDLSDTRKPAYAFKTVVQNVQANALLSAWTPAKDLIQGTLSTTLDFSGAGNEPKDLVRTLTLVGLAALSEGQLGPGPALEAIASFVKVPALRQVRFHDLKLPLRVVHGRVITDPVNLSGPAGDWKLAGAIGFDGALDYAVSVTLPPEAVAALNARSALAAGALSDDQGRMLLDLRVTGNAKAPRIAWDTGAMRDRVAGRASAALAAQRTKLEADTRAAAQQALAQSLGLGGADSTKKAPTVQAVRDSLKKAAEGLLDGFFGRKRPAPVDTTKH